MNSFSRFAPLAVVGMALSLLSACTVELQNTQPAQEMARLSKPAGSNYTGWRIFQVKCAACHGPSATGAAGPDLLPKVQEMGPRQFASLVLKRYDWNNAVDKAKNDALARGALLDDIVQRKEPELTMPAWEGEPTVTAHIADLYAYLAARAQGSQGPGRPAP